MDSSHGPYIVQWAPEKELRWLKSSDQKEKTGAHFTATWKPIRPLTLEDFCSNIARFSGQCFFLDCSPHNGCEGM
ncbi:hypothetical protein TNCT_118561 [Trichonephila clavata]|uniref:Uncharacterized protein n=1 Tax=Trichonephila clavata TaxID=2740835 RepID=A0A8X6H7C7_TRICU|nr:hypothetical protein TNCT_118561 [Trichonephila clavata]